MQSIDKARVHEQMRLVKFHDDARHLLVNRNDQLLDSGITGLSRRAMRGARRRRRALIVEMGELNC